MCRRYSNRINTLCVSILIVMFTYYAYRYYDFEFVYEPSTSNLFKTKNFSIISSFRLIPKCLCQKETILIREYKDYFNIMIENQLDSLYFSYNLSRQFFNSLTVTCDLYKVLRRGVNQKIISYSIQSDVEDHHLKYILKTNIKRAKRLYPNWVVRVYHKGSLSPNEECELECLRMKNRELLDNTDICDVTRLPVDLYNTWDASYILSSMLKYLPVGDDLVKAFVSRSVISCLFDREVAAVNEWLSSGRHFHVMRDHPDHMRNVISGLWGFVNSLDRKFSKHMLSIFTDKRVNSWFKSYDDETNPDELVLEKYVWPLVNSSIIHDSYNCKKSDNFYPFPTKRNPTSKLNN